MKYLTFLLNEIYNLDFRELRVTQKSLFSSFLNYILNESLTDVFYLREVPHKFTMSEKDFAHMFQDQKSCGLILFYLPLEDISTVCFWMLVFMNKRSTTEIIIFEISNICRKIELFI